MAKTQLGLEIALYLFPCGLFLTLLASQTFQFYRDRHRDTRLSATGNGPKEKAESLQRVYVRSIWVLQLVLSLLLLSSIVLGVRGAVAGHHGVAGTVEFPFSAYLVRPSIL